MSEAVEGNGAQPSNGVEQQESPHFYLKIPYIGRFSGIAQNRLRKLVKRFCKPVDIKLVFSTLKLRVCLTWKILSLTGSVRALCINVPVQVVMLVTSVKQADIFLHAYTSTYHRTDPHMSLNIYRIQSLVVPPVRQIVSQFSTLWVQGTKWS